jgi:hypothetical protein
MISPVVNYSVVSGQEDSDASQIGGFTMGGKDSPRRWDTDIPSCYLPCCILLECIPGCTGDRLPKWYNTFSSCVMVVVVALLLLLAAVSGALNGS